MTFFERKKLRRQSQRVLYKKQIEYIFGTEEFTRFAENLSTSGIFIKTPTPLPPHSNLVIRIPQEHGDALQLEGIVRHSREGRGMGVRFSALSPEDQKKLEEIIKPRWWAEV